MLIAELIVALKLFMSGPFSPLVQWRYIWAMIPEISIRKADFVFPNASVRRTRSRFVKFVDVLLYLHNGPIFKFKLDTWNYHQDNYFRDAFDRWILHLSRRNEFREFSFNLRATILYNLPTSLFSCRGLTILKLHDCRIKLPRGFQGFKLMRGLELQGCSINGDDLEKFVSGCPILDELVIKAGRCLDNYPKICAPKLQKFIIHGRFTGLLLKTPSLVKACFDLEVVPAEMNGRANLVEALGALPEVEVLGLHQQFLAYLAAGFLPARLSLTFNKLRVLALDVNLASHEEASVTWLILQNAPNLQELNLTNSTRDTAPSSTGLWQICSGHFFMSLRVVEFYEFFISVPEIAFLQFILGSAPLLEQLTIVREKDTDAEEKEAIVEIVKQIPKVSINLEISFE
ncbi:F-box/FBD/LRR-repeat protein [Carex littledalei]|uniref:F-box/FBD/LRR-repeat protein n=1 Tax=Carex littledalei TaxID=544730 RepID=A0A833R1N9_9POAL|nr:F-box/FBD/LRR-repeat protein [Carex littledalei]